MKLSIPLIFGLMLLVFPATAQVSHENGAITQNYAVYIPIEHYNGKLYEFFVWSNQFQKMPAWPKKLGNPPLSLRKAITLARTDLESFLPIAARWDCESVTWSPTGIRRWMYFVKFQPHNDYINGKEVSMTVTVLMDGTAIKPVVVDDPSLIRQRN